MSGPEKTFRLSCDNGFMTILVTAEQERILAEAIQSGLMKSPEDALAAGLEALRTRLPIEDPKTAEEWIDRFHAWVDSHAGQTVVLSDASRLAM
jgi:hypothetical protein